MKRTDLKKLYTFDKNWTRMGGFESLHARLDARDPKQGFWSVSAYVDDGDGVWRISSRPNRYESDERGYLEGRVPSSSVPRASGYHDKDVFTATKKIARQRLEDVLMMVAAEEGLA